MSINDVKADGTYWLVQMPAWMHPCHFNPPAADLDAVRLRYPQAGQLSRKISGADFLRFADEATKKEAA